MPVTTPSLPPLFGALPGGVELLLVTLLVFVVPVGLALWVGLDAREHSDHPLAWALAVLAGAFSVLFVGSLAVTILYVISREELGSHAPPTFGEADMDDDTVVLGQRLGEQRGDARATADDDEPVVGDDAADDTRATEDAADDTASDDTAADSSSSEPAKEE